ncbi:MAG: hypothetical protein AAB955_02760 [Patescibacteria group bacterium]
MSEAKGTTKGESGVYAYSRSLDYIAANAAKLGKRVGPPLVFGILLGGVAGIAQSHQEIANGQLPNFEVDEIIVTVLAVMLGGLVGALVNNRTASFYGQAGTDAAQSGHYGYDRDVNTGVGVK